MESNPNDSDLEQNTLEKAIHRRLVGLESGSYRRNTKFVLTEFTTWLKETRDTSEIADIEQMDCRRYAQYLRDCANSDDISARSARTYYAIIRAFLGWAVRDARIETNPAEWNGATEELPETMNKPERQFWSDQDRTSLLNYVDRRVDETLDGDRDISTERAFRDRALVYMLALSGVRGAEVFRSTTDEHRNGLSWQDLDLDNAKATVLGKSRQYEDAQLPEQVRIALERYRVIHEPPTERSPVFPTAHAPTKYRVSREQFAKAGDYTESEIEQIIDKNDIEELIYKHDIVLPAITTTGARTVMQRLCEEAGLEIDGEYFKPHGARRGLGHKLYAKGHAELAQTALRHSSIETTHESYSNIQTTETAKRVDQILDEQTDK